MLSAAAGVVATTDNTVISFALPPRHNISVTFRDRVYRSGEILSIVLDVYGMFQLQTSTGCDLTGVRVFADKTIAVFSGNSVAQVRSAVYV